MNPKSEMFRGPLAAAAALLLSAVAVSSGTGVHPDLVGKLARANTGAADRRASFAPHGFPGRISLLDNRWTELMARDALRDWYSGHRLVESLVFRRSFSL